MGVHPSIGYKKFPKQGSFLGKKVNVIFNYDTKMTVSGEIVRDDNEEPYRSIIKLDDGRYVLATECQYSLKKEEAAHG